MNKLHRFLYTLGLIASFVLGIYFYDKVLFQDYRKKVLTALQASDNIIVQLRLIGDSYVDLYNTAVAGEELLDKGDVEGFNGSIFMRNQKLKDIHDIQYKELKRYYDMSDQTRADL